MKKRLFVVLALAAVLATGLCACGQQGGASGGKQAADQFKTLADAFAVEGGDTISAYDESHYAYAFHDGETYTLVKADLPEGMYEKIGQDDMADEARKLLGELPVTEVTVLAKDKDIQKEIDGLKGKTGADLVKLGYEFTGIAVNGNQTDVSATKLPLAYLITFETAIQDDTITDIPPAVEKLKVVSVVPMGVDYEALGI